MLGLSSEEFWDLNFAQYVALIDRYEEVQTEKDYRSGVLAFIVRRGLGEKRAKLGDWFERLKTTSKRTSKQTSSGSFELLKANLRMRNAALEARRKDGAA